jgi:hypothetical protein
MPRAMPTLSNDTSTSSGGTPRVSLPLPVPSPMGAPIPGTHPPPLARPFEGMSPSHNTPTAMPRPSSRASTEDPTGTRLPSITPHGMLIEMGGDGPPPLLPQIKAEQSAFSLGRPGASPSIAGASLPGRYSQSEHPEVSADGDSRPELAAASNTTGVAAPVS